MSTISTSRQRGTADAAAWLADHGDVLWRYAMGRLRNAELAEELIQETLVAGLEGRERFRAECADRTWLLSILRRKMIDHVRRRGREVPAGRYDMPSGDALSEMYSRRGRWRIDPGPGPGAERADSPEFLADLERCLARIPANLAEVFVMREARAMPSEAICAVMQITLDNLWVRLHRARVLLRRCMAPRWAPGRKERC